PGRVAVIERTRERHDPDAGCHERPRRQAAITGPRGPPLAVPGEVRGPALCGGGLGLLRQATGSPGGFWPATARVSRIRAGPLADLAKLVVGQVSQWCVVAPGDSLLQRHDGPA